MKYRSFSLEELRESFTYDPVRGIFRSCKSGRTVGSYNSGTSLYLSKRKGDLVVQLRAAPLAWFLYYETLPEGEVWFKDGNVLSLRINNLYLMKKGQSRLAREPGRVPLEKTDNKYILYNPLRNYFIVCRGKKSPSYMADTFEEAIYVRELWENRPKVKIWDTFHKKMLYYDKNNYIYMKN